MPYEIVTVKASSAEIARVIQNISNTIREEDAGAAIMGALGTVFLLQRPSMNATDLIEAINQASSWIAFYLEDMDGIPKERIN